MIVVVKYDGRPSPAADSRLLCYRDNRRLRIEAAVAVVMHSRRRRPSEGCTLSKSLRHPAPNLSYLTVRVGKYGKSALLCTIVVPETWISGPWWNPVYLFKRSLW